MMEYEVNPLVIELENFYYNNLLIIGKIHAVQYRGPGPSNTDQLLMNSLTSCGISPLYKFAPWLKLGRKSPRGYGKP